MIIPTGYMQGLLGFTGPGVPNGAAVTFGFAATGTSVGEENALALFEAAADHLMLELTNKVTLSVARIKMGPNSVGPVYEFTGTATGNQSAESVTPNVAALVQKRGVLGGRANRGRFFLPGLAEGSVTAGGLLESGYMANLQDAVDDFFAATAVTLGDHVILHSTSSDPTIVTSTPVDPKVATQRRRLR